MIIMFFGEQLLNELSHYPQLIHSCGYVNTQTSNTIIHNSVYFIDKTVFYYSNLNGDSISL